MNINESDESFSWKWFALIIITIIYMLYKIIISQDRSSYDYYPGMPDDFIKWLK